MGVPKNVLGVIPARIESRRFPGKPLVKILGKPMLQLVFEQARACKKIDRLIIATDSIEIKQEARSFGAEVCMTSSEHPTGLDRLIEVQKKINGYDLFVNIQGDEPLIHPETISGVVQLFQRFPSCEIGSSAVPFENYHDFLNPDHVKVVLAENNSALYFSRSPIPYSKLDELPPNALKHQGLYAYTKEALEKIDQSAPCEIEELESLEQLRFLRSGMNIFIHETPHDSIGVDHPEDVFRVEKILKMNPGGKVKRSSHFAAN